jgi:hypothetical protein
VDENEEFGAGAGASEADVVESAVVPQGEHPNRLLRGIPSVSVGSSTVQLRGRTGREPLGGGPRSPRGHLLHVCSQLLLVLPNNETRQPVAGALQAMQLAGLANSAAVGGQIHHFGGELSRRSPVLLVERRSM